MRAKKRPYLLILVTAILASPFTQADTFDIRYTETAVQQADTVVVLTDDSIALNPQPLQPYQGLSNIISQESFTGQKNQLLEVLSATADENASKRLILLGAGDKTKLNVKIANQLGATLAVKLQNSQAEHIVIDTQAISSDLTNADIAAQLAHGVQLRHYQFTKYHTTKATDKKRQLTFIVSDGKAATAKHQQLSAITEGVFLARDLTNEPANELTPEAFAKHALELKKLGVKVDVLAEKELNKQGLGAIIAVGKGSVNPPRLVIAHYKGSNAQPVAIVGKGITFDTGGYNLKTSAESIHRMTSDMAGGAAVLGTIKALALQKAAVNVVGVIALAENRISDTAFLPGDIIKTGSGLTVEILSTDAEGRLVLADALWWVNQHHKPAAIVDLATLTGAKFTALGAYYAGAFTEHDLLLQQLQTAGETVDEKIWRLPLSEEFAPEVRSRVADLRNTGRSTGASSAAYFLQQFVADTPWVHLDIAGNALSNSSKGVTPEGATGFGVRLLTEWLTTQQQ